MERTIDDTLRYVLLITRHIRKGRVRGAILALLMDLGFSESLDGISFTQESIYLRYYDNLLRFNTIYSMVAQRLGLGYDTNLIEQGVRRSINDAWENGSRRKWFLLFYPERRTECPTNGQFIARCACLMRLLCDCWDECCDEEADLVG